MNEPMEGGVNTNDMLFTSPDTSEVSANSPTTELTIDGRMNASA